jgi:hypothetical protein
MSAAGLDAPMPPCISGYPGQGNMMTKWFACKCVETSSRAAIVLSVMMG